MAYKITGKQQHTTTRNFISEGYSFLSLLLYCLIVTSCSTRSYKELSREDPKNIHYKGHYKIGKEYNIKGKAYKPKKDINYNQIGVASWYGSRFNFHGRKTANGDIFNKYMLTAAHPKLPMPSLIKVTNLKNKKSLILMVNDRGPFVKGRILDASERAAEILGFKKSGIAKVRVKYLHKDTHKFLKNIALLPKENSKAKKRKDIKCSINCHIKLVNLKHNLAITP